MLDNLKTFIPLLVLSVIAIGATFGDGNFIIGDVRNGKFIDLRFTF